MSHFRYNPEVSDEELYEQGYNRVYDTLEPETNLDDVEKVMAEVLEGWDPNEVMCSYKLNHAIGSIWPNMPRDNEGILKSAFEKGVPVFVPAFTDSELGLDVALSNRMREAAGRHKLRFDPFEDLEHFARRPCCGRSGWEFSPSEAECRGTGRSSSVRSLSCGTGAWGRTFR